MLVASINGPDNVGKTTQIRFLRSDHPEIADLGGIQLYIDEQHIVEGAPSAAWWFRDSSSMELITVVSRSFRTRHEMSKERSDLVLLDRGAKQFEAVLIASVMVKDGLDEESARELVRSFGQELYETDTETFRVLLTHGVDAATGAQHSLASETYASEHYQRYQLFLNDLLLKQARSGTYHEVIDCTGKSILAVQNELRASLRQRGMDFRPLFEHVETIYAFGGLSESGKSTAAEYLRKAHHAARLKISYLLELARNRTYPSTDIYALPEFVIAELLVMELDRFSRYHYYLSAVSIESLHRSEMTACLKRFLGNKLLIIYCKASDRNRLTRSDSDQAALQLKDATKISRGADRIEKISDAIVNNDGPLLSLYWQLDALANSFHVDEFRPFYKTIQDLALPVSAGDVAQQLLTSCRTKFGLRLLLFAVIGSWGRQSGHEGWSDLDVLIVVEPGSTSDLRSVVTEIARIPKNLRLGITVVTRPELRLGHVDSKVIHSLRLISLGKIAVQMIADGLRLASMGYSADLSRSLAFLPSAVQTLRREITDLNPSPRRIFKTVLVICKILLRVERIETDDEQDILDRCEAVYSFGLHEYVKSVSDVFNGGLAPDRAVQLGTATLEWIDRLYLESHVD
jgi:predicted nucleotidyltransferase